MLDACQAGLPGGLWGAEAGRRRRHGSLSEHESNRNSKNSRVEQGHFERAAPGARAGGASPSDRSGSGDPDPPSRRPTPPPAPRKSSFERRPEAPWSPLEAAMAPDCDPAGGSCSVEDFPRFRFDVLRLADRLRAKLELPEVDYEATMVSHGAKGGPADPAWRRRVPAPLV